MSLQPAANVLHVTDHQSIAQTPPAESLAQLGNAKAASRDDPYFGLLTQPPGEWGIIAYGSAQMLIIKGSSDFRERSLIFLSNYIGGVKQRKGWMPDDRADVDGLLITEGVNYAMVPLSKARLTQALTTWFYGRIYQRKHDSTPVFGPFDEETGEAPIIRWDLHNEEAMTQEAAALAAAFYESIDGTSLGCRFDSHSATPEDWDALGSAYSRFNTRFS